VCVCVCVREREREGGREDRSAGVRVGDKALKSENRSSSLY